MSILLLSGFTFIRNAVKFDFPVRECIQSLLPIVDELVINVGKSEDGTEALIEKIAQDNIDQNKKSKIRIIHSVWDDQSTKDGLVLSEQTNLALKECRGRWCFYLQADEAIHENENRKIRNLIEDLDRAESPPEAISFQYLHFYGGYSLIQRSWKWYPSEIRVIRNEVGALSFGDAQTFKHESGRNLVTINTDALIFHYGHAREPEKMREKISYFHRFWHGDHHGISVNDAYGLDFKNLVWFWKTHPLVYFERIKKGLLWSLKPSQLIENYLKSNTKSIKEKTVVIILNAYTHQLGEELRGLLLSHGFQAERVIFSSGMSSWWKTVKRALFSKKNNIVVDLLAESRSHLLTPFYASDFIFAFSYRIAHAPTGHLSPFRRWLYDSISWGTHEINSRDRKNSYGFTIPDVQHARQLARWLGVDC